MAYTTPDDVFLSMRNLPERLKTDTTFVDDNIAKADAFINAFLGEVYSVPFPEGEVPDLIKHIATDLTVFFIAEDLYSSEKPNLDSYQEKRYHRAVSMLEKIATDDIFIVAERKNKVKSGFASTNDEIIFTLDEPEW